MGCEWLGGGGLGTEPDMNVILVYDMLMILFSGLL